MDGPEEIAECAALRQLRPPRRHPREKRLRHQCPASGLKVKPNGATRVSLPEEAAAEVAEPAPAKRGLKADATPVQHLVTHAPTSSHCPTCQRAQARTRACPRRTHEEDSRPTQLGDIVTADHIAMREADAGRGGERAALVVKDTETKWMACYPLPNKISESARRSLDHFEGGRRVVHIDMFYSDSAPGLNSVAKALGWTHEVALPGRPATNGVAERAVRSVLEAARSALRHAGFPEHYWSFAGQRWCFAHNITIDGVGD